jgi:hypothetical protein
MKHRYMYNSKNQRGAVTLAVTVILLLLVGMITVYMANISRKEQLISADQYRTEQSLDAALAALDYALDYYNENGLDADDNGTVDTLVIPDIASGELTVSAEAFYCDIRDADFWTDPENCDQAIDLGEENYARFIGIVATGWSDDHTARRVVTQLATDLSPFPDGEAPKGPLTTHGAVNFTGNASIINRYYRDNIWSGETVSLASSATVESFVGDPDIYKGSEKFDPDNRADMIAPGTANTIPGVLPATSVERGVNSDVIDNDPLLSGLDNSVDNPDCTVDGNNHFFCAFLGVDNKGILRSFAESGDQVTTTCSELNGVEGFAYWEPADPGTDDECKLNGNLVAGSSDEPAFIFVDGDLTIGGGEYYGFLYVKGDLTIEGNFIIYGSMTAEGNFAQKAGTGKFIYDPYSVNPPDGFKYAKGPIEGTFRDFATTN